MGVSIARLGVDVYVDSKDAQRGLADVDRRLGQTEKRFGQTGAGALALTGGLAAVGVAALKSVKSASDLNEQVNKSKVVFGAASDVVVKTADDMAERFGVAKTTFIDAAGSLGLIVKAAGYTQSAAADMGAEFGRLAADASSFFNVPLEEALQAIRSGLVGEAEPLRRFGVLLSEAAVKSKAAELGLAGVTGELSEQAKVQARVALITEGLTDASGDLARTQDATANQMRKAQGQIGNFAAEVGEKLLPSVNAGLSGLVAVLERVDPQMVIVAASAAALFGAVRLASTGIGKLKGALTSGNLALAGAAVVFGEVVAAGVEFDAILSDVASGFDALAAEGAPASKFVDQFKESLEASDEASSGFGRTILDISNLIAFQSPQSERWGQVLRESLEEAARAAPHAVDEIVRYAQATEDARMTTDGLVVSIDGERDQVVLTAAQLARFAAITEAAKVATEESRKELVGWERAGQLAAKTARDDVAPGFDAVAGLSEAAKDEVAGLAAVFADFGGAGAAYGAALEAAEEAARDHATAVAESTSSSSDSWEDYLGDVTVTLDAIRTQLLEQLTAQNEYQANLLVIARRGGAELASVIRDEWGPDQAAAVADLAAATNDEFGNLGGLILETQRRTGDEYANEWRVMLGAAEQIAAAGATDTAAAIANRLEVLPADLARIMARFGGDFERAWTVAESIGVTGADRTVEGVAAKLRVGVSVAARIVEDYAAALADGVNPVIVAVGGRKIVVTAGSGAHRRAVEESPTSHAWGKLPDEALIQRSQGSGLVQWAEADAGPWEAFIPGAISKRGRARQITEEVARRLGGMAVFAGGGFRTEDDVPPIPSFAPLRPPISYAGEAAADFMRAEVAAYVKAHAATALGPGVGSPAMVAALKHAFPDVAIYSTYRPGARTHATGAVSYHSMVGSSGPGRAVDFTPSLEINRWVADHYQAITKELILSLPGAVNIKNGARRGFFSEPTFSDHLDHNHWAMARGGIREYDHGGVLPPGLSVSWNGTGRGEIVPDPTGAGGIVMHNTFNERVDPLHLAGELAWQVLGA